MTKFINLSANVCYMKSHSIVVPGAVGITTILATSVASAGTFIMEDSQLMPLSIYQILIAVVVLAGYYSFTYHDFNSFTDVICSLVCAFAGLFLTIFSFWGIQDPEGHIWKSGWLGTFWAIVMAFFVMFTISKILDIAKREGDKVSF